MRHMNHFLTQLLFIVVHVSAVTFLETICSGTFIKLETYLLLDMESIIESPVCDLDLYSTLHWRCDFYINPVCFGEFVTLPYILRSQYSSKSTHSVQVSFKETISGIFIKLGTYLLPDMNSSTVSTVCDLDLYRFTLTLPVLRQIIVQVSFLATFIKIDTHLLSDMNSSL